MSEKKEYIRIRGAREHNLKNINIDIPRNEFVVLTGLSGSGKSSLAFDTIYAFSNPEVKAVLHDAEIVDENGVATGAASLFSIRGSRAGILKNLLKNSYVGCCMAFRKELIPIICPIPNEMYMHDYWIGTAAEYMGKVCFLDEPLIGYRRHSSNVTQMTHGSIRFMIKKRIDIIRCLGLLKKRVRKVKA